MCGSFPSSAIFVNMSLSKPWGIVKDREAWHSTVHVVTKSQTWLSEWTTITTTKCLAGHTSETIRPCTFLGWKFLNHSFSQNACDWPVHLFYFFLLQSWKVVPFWEFVLFFQIVNFTGISLLVIISTRYNFVFLQCQLQFLLFTFIILLIWILSLFFLKAD